MTSLLEHGFGSSCREHPISSLARALMGPIAYLRREDHSLIEIRWIATKASGKSRSRGTTPRIAGGGRETQQQTQTWLMMMSRLRLRESQSCPSLASMANGAAARASSAARNLERLMSSGHRRTEKHICTVCSCFIELPVNRHSKVNACCMKMVRNGFDQLSIRVPLAL